MAGFRPIQDMSGSSYTGKITQYSIASTHSTLLAIGDLVTITGIADSTGIPLVNFSTVGGLITGVIVGFAPNFSNLEQQGMPVGTGGYVLVADSPFLLLEAPVSATGIALGDVGSNADISNTTATLSGGLVHSNMTVDVATIAGAGATAQVRIEGIKDGTLGADAILRVRINESTVTGTVGV